MTAVAPVNAVAVAVAIGPANGIEVGVEGVPEVEIGNEAATWGAAVIGVVTAVVVGVEVEVVFEAAIAPAGATLAARLMRLAHWVP